MNKNKRKQLAYLTIVVGLLCLSIVYVADLILN